MAGEGLCGWRAGETLEELCMAGEELCVVVCGGGEAVCCCLWLERRCVWLGRGTVFVCAMGAMFACDGCVCV